MSAQETKVVPLKPCPCGKTPESLHLYGETHQAKWAMVMGSCCNEWLVEFKNHYATDPDVIMLNAIEAWNLAERAAAPSPVEPELCEWREDEDGNWFAMCGAAWVFEHDGPDENGVNFCYCCGKSVIPIAYQQYIEPDSAEVTNLNMYTATKEEWGALGEAQTIIEEKGEHYAALLLKALEKAL